MLFTFNHWKYQLFIWYSTFIALIIDIFIIIHIILDWKVLQLILQEVPKVMQNKALILSRHGNDIDLLAAAVCSIVSVL